MRPLLVLLLAGSLAAPAAASGQAPPRARGVMPTTAVDSFRIGDYHFHAGATPHGEVAIWVVPEGGWLRYRSDVAVEWYPPDSVRAWVERASPEADSSLVGSRAGLHVVIPGGEAGRQGTGWARFNLCHPGRASSANHSRFETYRPLLAMLRRAARAAATRPSAPPREEPAVWWAHAVGCPAYPRNAPRLEPEAAAAPLVARFVVGPDGSPDPATLEALPGTAPERVETLRRALPEWRFTPATRGGRAVPQVVFTLVSPHFHPVDRRFWAGAEPAPDGLVVLRSDPGTRGPAALIHRAFFTPDEVDAWAARVRAGLFPALLAEPEDGAPTRSTVVAGTATLAGRLHLRVSPARCGREPTDSSDSTLVAKLQGAAAVARDRRLRIDTVRVFAHDDVDCPARPDSANPLPRAPARAQSTELHATVVVGRDGRVEPGSLRVMPASDPALTGALRAVLPRWSFVPATRVGRPVRQLVLLPVIFRADGVGEIAPP